MSGELEKSKFLDEFLDVRPDLFFPEAWDDNQKKQVLEEINPRRSKSAMFASIPMRCEGAKCPVADTCPLLKKNLAPVGESCPIEAGIVHAFMNEYMNELNVDPDTLVEVSMVRDLVDLEIQYIRSSKRLAKEDFISKVVVGINEKTGEPIINEQLHVAIDFQDRIYKRKRDLRKELLASREARVKLGMGDVDNSQVIAKIIEKAREIDLAQEAKMRKELGIITKAEAFYKEDIIDAEVISPESE